MNQTFFFVVSKWNEIKDLKYWSSMIHSTNANNNSICASSSASIWFKRNKYVSAKSNLD
jgi:hypothetical protein